MKSQRLEQLLYDLFKAEKKYLEVADIVQDTALKRYLNFQSSERNRFCNKIIELLSSYNIEHSKTYIEKDLLNYNGDKAAQLLQPRCHSSLVSKCLDKDKAVINHCNKALEDTSLPIELLECITDLELYLLFQSIEISKRLDRFNITKQKNNSNKVFHLRLAN